MRRPLRPAAVALIAALSIAPPLEGVARADGVDALMIHGTTAALDVGEKDLGEVTGEGEPAVLEGQHVKLLGSGKKMGAALRGVTQTREGYRVGLGLGFFTTEGLGLGELTLPPGLSAGAGAIWGIDVDLSIGKAFVGSSVQPYVDLHLVTNLLWVGVDFSSDEYGYLGSVAYEGVSASAGPRVGLFIPIGSTLCIDLAGSYTLFGVERASVSVGIGLWDGILEPERSEPPPPRSAPPPERDDTYTFPED